MPRMKLVTALVALALPVALLAGCGDEGGSVAGDPAGSESTSSSTPSTTGDMIPGDQVAAKAEVALASEVDNLKCPNLEGQDGNRVTCTMTVKGKELKIEVTATEVDRAIPSMSYTFAEV